MFEFDLMLIVKMLIFFAISAFAVFSLTWFAADK